MHFIHLLCESQGLKGSQREGGSIFYIWIREICPAVCANRGDTPTPPEMAES